jgi:hypothetical protein
MRGITGSLTNSDAVYTEFFAELVLRFRQPLFVELNPPAGGDFDDHPRHGNP